MLACCLCLKHVSQCNPTAAGCLTRTPMPCSSLDVHAHVFKCRVAQGGARGQGVAQRAGHLWAGHERTGRAGLAPAELRVATVQVGGQRGIVAAVQRCSSAGFACIRSPRSSKEVHLLACPVVAWVCCGRPAVCPACICRTFVALLCQRCVLACCTRHGLLTEVWHGFPVPGRGKPRVLGLQHNIVICFANPALSQGKQM